MAERAPTADFEVGQSVLHAKHGAGKIVSIEEQNYGGALQEYYVIAFERDKLTMRVPLTGNGVLEFRTAGSSDGLGKILKILQGDAKPGRKIWSQRVEGLTNKLHSGNVIALAEVVRDLYVAPEVERSYSATEIFEAALQKLVAEVALIQGTDEVSACAYLAKESGKSLTIRSSPTPVRVGGLTPSPLDGNRHGVVKAVPPPSAMEERLKGVYNGAETTATHPFKPSNAAVAKLEATPRPVLQVRRAVTPPAQQHVAAPRKAVPPPAQEAAPTPSVEPQRKVKPDAQPRRQKTGAVARASGECARTGGGKTGSFGHAAVSEEVLRNIAAVREELLEKIRVATDSLEVLHRHIRELEVENERLRKVAGES